MTGEIGAGQAGAAEPCQMDQPYEIVVNRKKRRFEIAPRVCNVWERAFATDSYNDDDLACYERQKEYTEFVFVGERRTLTDTAAFPPARSAMLESITLPKTVAGKRVPGRMKFEGDVRPIIIVNGHWEDTATDDLNEIERIRRRREPGGAGAGQPAVLGVSVRVVDGASAAAAAVQVPSEACGRDAVAAEHSPVGMIEPLRVPVAVSLQPQATPVGGDVTYPLQVGRLTVHGADWKLITFVGKQVRLSPEIKKVVKAMYTLGAKSNEDAKTTREIFLVAGVRHDDGERSLSNVFSSGRNRKEEFRKVFENCICKTEDRPPKYYLTQ